MIKIGVIADDFTGGTDIASFMVKGGLPTLQVIGVPSFDISDKAKDIEALVISLKSRSCPKEIAIADSIKAAEYLKKIGCRQIIFKYCSTFDSTKDGNIGPVTDALMKYLNCSFTIFSPALPINGRTVYFGQLFVKGELLNESPMRYHPLNPMTKSSVIDLVHMQSDGKCSLISHEDLQQETSVIHEKIAKLKEDGFNYVAVDAIDEKDLLKQAEVFKDYPFITGGSGIGYAMAKIFSQGQVLQDSSAKGNPNQGKAIVLSGSCSAMTNKQVNLYKEKAPSVEIDITKLLDSKQDIDSFVSEILENIKQVDNTSLAPIVYSTATPDLLSKNKEKYKNIDISRILEDVFYKLSVLLKESGYTKFIIAGGETSGQVTKALGVTGFYIGPTIAPGVPWVKAINEDISLALKSGNFGDEMFFFKAQDKESF